MFDGYIHSMRPKCERTFFRPLPEFFAMWIGGFFSDHKGCQIAKFMRERILQFVLIIDDLFG
jgi:hypothetical protein